MTIPSCWTSWEWSKVKLDGSLLELLIITYRSLYKISCRLKIKNCSMAESVRKNGKHKSRTHGQSVLRRRHARSTHSTRGFAFLRCLFCTLCVACSLCGLCHCCCHSLLVACTVSDLSLNLCFLLLDRESNHVVSISSFRS